MARIIAIDCFCGAGGTTRGFLDAGIEVVKGFDIDPRCGVNFSENNSGAEFVNADIRTVDPERMVDLNFHSGAQLLLSGCAPCQPFSKRGSNGDGDADTDRRTLLESFGVIVEALMPEFVFVENVPGIQNVRGRSTFVRFLHRLDAIGYRYKHAVINAAEYGVPQNRSRLILIAARDCSPEFPSATHGAKAFRPFKNVKSTISHYPPLHAGQLCMTVPNHQSMDLSPLNLTRIRHTPQDGGDRRSWPEHLQLMCHSRLQSGHTDVYGRMWWNRPAPTLTGRCNSLSNGRYGHPNQNRAISLREAAALQTFSDDFSFKGKMTDIAQQIGNAVPPNFARAFGFQFMKLAQIAARRKKKKS